MSVTEVNLTFREALALQFLARTPGLAKIGVAVPESLRKQFQSLEGKGLVEVDNRYNSYYPRFQVLYGTWSINSRGYAVLEERGCL